MGEYWVPRAICLGGERFAAMPAVIAVSELLLFLAYMFLGVSLVMISRRDLGGVAGQFRPIMFLFGWFIIACGLTHLAELVVIFYPAYWLLTASLVTAATISVGTAAVVLLNRRRLLEFLGVQQ